MQAEKYFPIEYKIKSDLSTKVRGYKDNLYGRTPQEGGKRPWRLFFASYSRKSAAYTRGTCIREIELLVFDCRHRKHLREKSVKYTINKIEEGENEVNVRYCTLTPEIDQIISILKNERRKVIGLSNNQKIVVDVADILYIESVDGRSYAYTENDVIKLDHTLFQLEQLICEINFFRCSKSMIINIDKVKSLKSFASNRIDATMCNGEHVMISRTYASDFRKRLKEGSIHE